MESRMPGHLVVVVTGGSAGIGEATARLIVSQGSRVVIGARDGARLAATAGSLGALAHPVVVDVTRRTDLVRLRDEALERFGHVDVWINNAGRGIARPVLELTDEDLTDMLDVNLRSVLYGMQSIVPYFVRQERGHLINVSSFLARVPLAPMRSAYSAAKAAVNSLTANLRMDLERTSPGVRVSTVMPGLVATEFANNARGQVGPVVVPPAGPMRAQSAEEVAAAILRVIAHPVAEAYTNEASPELARRYFDALGAFTPVQA